MMVFCLPFICKHNETLVKTIRCNLTKACQIFATLTESLYKNMGILPKKKSKKIYLFIEELYALLYHWYMYEALSLLVY